MMARCALFDAAYSPGANVRFQFVGRGLLAAGVAPELAAASVSPLEIQILAPTVAAATLVTVASGSLDQSPSSIGRHAHVAQEMLYARVAALGGIVARHPPGCGGTMPPSGLMRRAAAKA
jgi:hypothetical protein